MDIIPIRRALLSVSDKTGVADFAKQLARMGVEIISTGGTSHALKDANILHRQVEDMTGMPEMLDGRVKTLHPKVHGGILGRRDEHAAAAALHQIEWIDLVVVNFYPFEQLIQQREQLSWAEAVESIDVGGPAMMRAAAKNFAWVGAIVDPHDYSEIITELHNVNGLSFATRQYLAEKAFSTTSHYDNMIYQYFLGQNENKRLFPQYLDLQLEKLAELRYGENPHQKACAYRFKHQTGILTATPLQGKPLSYNNVLDAEAAQNAVNEFLDPACVIVKHANPCGAATADTIEDAYQRAYQADSLSAFGGTIALNRPCTQTIAEAVASIFAEVMIAPAYTEEALVVLAHKANLRVLELPIKTTLPSWEMKFISGGALLQDKDSQEVQAKDLKIVTLKRPSQEDIQAMLFAWKVLKHIKSNAILIAKRNATVGMGCGQVSRIDAVDLAIRKAGDHIKETILASDAFFPFRDSIDRIGQVEGIRAIIQPGGSVRDEEVIAACNEYGLTMVFTGKRCFKH